MAVVYGVYGGSEQASGGWQVAGVPALGGSAGREAEPASRQPLASGPRPAHIAAHVDARQGVAHLPQLQAARAHLVRQVVALQHHGEQRAQAAARQQPPQAVLRRGGNPRNAWHIT